MRATQNSATATIDPGYDREISSDMPTLLELSAYASGTPTQVHSELSAVWLLLAHGKKSYAISGVLIST
jgi:hypothetical protein